MGKSEALKSLIVLAVALALYLCVLPVLVWLILDIAPPGMGIPMWVFYAWLLAIAVVLGLGKMAVYLWKEVD